MKKPSGEKIPKKVGRSLNRPRLSAHQTRLQLYRANIGFHGIPRTDVPRVLETGLRNAGYHRVHEQDTGSGGFVGDGLKAILGSIGCWGGARPALLIIDLNKVPQRTEILHHSRFHSGSGDIHYAPPEAMLGHVSLTEEEFRRIRERHPDESKGFPPYSRYALVVGRRLMEKALRLMQRKRIIRP